ncbi:MAG: hypothetical protein PHI66_04280 [Candidatus Pacebacteria bacterium]|nr:hypothetical protein [Candidatus Paceibacterota bacterium]
MTDTYKKISTLLLLFLITISFSGCSIRKADEEVKVKENEKIIENVKNPDTDGDGLSDEEERKIGTNINNPDTDGDGLSDFEEEAEWATDPLEADTDNDGYEDGSEVEAGYDPLNSGQLDSDKDGLGNADEIKLGTDPKKFDTDKDGLSDKEEVDEGRDPLMAGI